MAHWEYLEVAVDLSKKTWKDSAGRSVKLRKGSTAPILAEVGRDGWELSGSVPLDRANGAYRLYFKRAQADAQADNAQSDTLAAAAVAEPTS